MAGRSVLLIVDMQNELLHPEGKLYGHGFPREFDRLVPNVQAVLAASRARGVAAVFVYTEFEGHGPQEGICDKAVPLQDDGERGVFSSL